MEHALTTLTHASHGTTIFFTGVLILLIASLALEEKIHARVTIIHKHGIKLSFGGFVRKALPFAAMHIVLATVYVLVFF